MHSQVLLTFKILSGPGASPRSSQILSLPKSHYLKLCSPLEVMLMGTRCRTECFSEERRRKSQQCPPTPVALLSALHPYPVLG